MDLIKNSSKKERCKIDGNHLLEQSFGRELIQETAPPRYKVDDEDIIK